MFYCFTVLHLSFGHWFSYLFFYARITYTGLTMTSRYYTMTDSTGESGFLPTVTFTSPNNTFTAAQRVQQLLNETGITGFYEADFADNITIIDTGAFQNDVKVVVVTINKVTTIGNNAFSGCSALRSITLDCAVDANKKYLLTSIGTNAFQQCTSLRNLHIPDTVKIIPNYMCYGCSSLEVAVMGYGYNRSGDTYVTDSTIGSNAFNNCYNLSYFVVPETVSSIGDLAFANNIALTHFYILGTPTVAADAFFQARSNTTIYYYNTTSNISSLFPTNTIKRPYTEYTITATGELTPATVRSTIPANTYWKGKIAASVTSLATGCFSGATGGADIKYPYMVAVSLPPNLNTIGYGAFINTDGTSGYSCIVGAFYIPNTVVTLGTIYNTSNTFAGLNTTLRDTSTTKQIVFQSGPNTIAFPAVTCNHTSAMAIIVPNVTSFGQECFNQANKVQLYSFFQKNAYTAATRLDHTTDDGGHNAFTWNFYKGGGYTHYLYIPKQITRMAIQLFRGIRDKIYVTAYHNSISTTGVTADTGLGFGFLSYSPTDGANNRFTGTTAPTLNIIYNYVDANGATLFGGTGIGNDANFFINVLYPSSVKTINQRFNVYTYLNSVAVDHNASQTVTIANEAFLNCTRLKYLYFNNRVKTIGFNAFRNAPLNSSFDLIDASPLEAIYHAAFISDNPYTCNIVQITIPKTVKALGTHVFACQQDVAPLINQKPAFTTLSFEDGIEFWGDYNYTLGPNTTLTAYEVNNTSSLKYMAIPAHFCQRCYSLQNVSFLNTVDASGNAIPNDGLALARPDNRLPIPTRYNKQILTNKIKRIGQLAFFCNYRLQSIRIPDGVTTIDLQAFYDNYSVTYLYLPDTLTTMGLGAFNYLGAINQFSYTGQEVSVRMPQNMIDFVVPETGSGGTGYFNTNATATRYFTVAFDNTSASGKVTNGVLGRFTNQASNAYIKYHVIIQNGITGLLGNSSGGTRAFDGFTGLKTLTIADTVTNIGPGAIEGCTGLTNVFISPTSNLTILDVNSFKTCSSLSSFFIPNSLRSIYETAFTGCTGLTNVFISPTSNLSSIGAGAFMSCSAITTFFIPNSVIRLGNDAFNNCAKLSSVTFGDNPGLKYIGNQAFVNSMNSLTRVHIPASVIYIGRAAFINYFTTTNYNNLTTVTFGAGSRLKSISGSCFGSYTGWSNSQPAKYLQNLVLPNSIQYMGIPNSAGTDISDSTGDVLRSTHTLAHSANLVMPSSLQCLSWAIFYDSGSFDVSNVYLPISLNPNPGPRRHNGYRTNSQGGEEFATSKSGSLLYSPSGFVLQNTGTGRAYSYYKTRSYSASPLITLDLFSSVTNTTDPINTTQIHAAIQEGVLVIGDGGANSIAGSTAGYRSNLISVNIPSTVTTISRNAFNGCGALTYVTFSENSHLTIIGPSAFRDCTMIHDIQLPDTLTTIGANAFSGCYNLASISIPYNVTSIGAGAFNVNSSSPTTYIPRQKGYLADQLGGDINGEAVSDYSGWSVSLSQDGKILAIGSVYNDGNGQDAGQVRVYKYQTITDTTWSNYTVGSFSNTGTSPFNKPIVVNGGDPSPIANKYYWVQLGSDINGETGWNQFGYSVSLSSDGSTVAIGALLNYSAGPDAGLTRVYKYQTVTDASWNSYTINSFTYNGTAPTNKPIIVNGGDANPVSGKFYWVQLGGDIDGVANSQSGNSVALNSNGTVVVIGARYADIFVTDGGSIRIYQYSSGTWNQLGSTISGGSTISELIGSSVAISDDGFTVAYGAPKYDTNGVDRGLVNIFKWNGTTWSQLGGTHIQGGAAEDNAGDSISLSSDGTIVAIGAVGSDGGGPDSGHVRVFKFNGSSWIQLGQNINGLAGWDHFGNSVSLSSDGTILAVGSRYSDAGVLIDAGLARIYKYYNGAWQQLGPDIRGAAAWEISGYSVSLSKDGTTVAIGAYGNDGNGIDSGTVRVYQISNFTVRMHQRLYDTIHGSFSTYFPGISPGSVQVVPELILQINDTATSFTPTNNLSIHYRQYQLDIPSIIVNNANDLVVAQAQLTSTLGFVHLDINYNIPIGAFLNNTKIYSVAICPDVTSIGDNAFSGCTNLTYLSFHPDSTCNFIGANAFYNTVLYDLVLPDSLTSIGTLAFHQNNSIKQIGQDIDGEAAADYSGASVSLSADGSTLAIGAFFNDGTNVGNTNDERGHVRVYKYDRNKTANVTDQASLDYGPVGWRRLGKDIDAEAAGDEAGRSVSLSADGTIVAIGAILNDGNGNISGHVRVYQYDLSKTTNVTDQASLDYGPVGWRRLGQDINGEVADDESGQSVSLSADGTIVAIGARYNDGTTVGTTGDNRGHVRVYKYDLNKTTNVTDQASPDYGPVGWRRRGKDIDGELAYDESGFSVSLSADGAIVAIGATKNDGNGSDSGHVRVYQYDVTKTANVTDQASDDYGPVGWRRLGQDINGEFDTDLAGRSVSLSADGFTLAIGAIFNDGTTGNNSGHVRVYQYDVNKTANVTNESSLDYGPVRWRRLGQDINGEVARDESGQSVSLSADGSILAIGAPYNDGNGNSSGHVRVYQYDPSKTTNVTNQASLDFGPVGWRRLGQDIDGEAAGDYSGFSVSLSADGLTLAIGASDNDGTTVGSTSDNRGHVKVYQILPALTSVRIHEQLYNDISGTLSTYFTLPSKILFNVVPELILQINDTPTVAQTNNLYIRYQQSQLGIPTIIVTNANDLVVAQAQLASSAGFVHLNINYDIPVGAFLNYTKIYSVAIGPDVTSIGDNAFSGCTNLTYFSFHPNSTCTVIGANAFYNTALYDLVLPDSLTSIGTLAFQNKIFSIKQIGQDIDGEATGDQSGYSVSLSADGTIIAIGATNNDGNGNNSGHVRVYKYDRNKTTNVTDQNDPNFGPVGWRRLGKDIDGEAADDQSGWLVSLSADGTIVAIGAYQNDGTTVGSTGDNRGHVRVYKYDVNKTTNVTLQSDPDFGPVGWRRLGQDIDGEALDDRSGFSVSLSTDGTVVAIGANNNDGNGNNSGHVRVYKYDVNKTENVTDQANLDFGPVGWRRLGQDINGEASNDTSGTSVSISADGLTLAIGAPGNNGNSADSGHVRVYKYDLNKTENVTDQSSDQYGPVGWRRLGQDINGEAGPDLAGQSVSLSADGTIVAIGANLNDGNGNSSGHVRVFKYQTISDSTWTNYNATSFSYTGTSPNNKPIVIAGGDATPTLGKSYWVQIGGDIDGEAANDETGKLVSLSADGLTLAIGTNLNDGTMGNTSDNRGHVRVYQYDATKTENVTDQNSLDFGPVGWRRLGPDIDGDAAGDQSGKSVSLSADGSTLAIGANFNDGTSGITGDERGHVKVYQVLSPKPLNSVYIQEQLYNDISGTLSTYFTVPSQILFNVVPELISQDNDTAISFNPTISQTNNLSIRYLQYQLGIPTILVTNANDLAVAQTQLASIVGFVHLHINYDIPISAFANNTKIYSVTIGPDVTSIGNNAFSGCTNLAYLSFHPNSTCAVIGANAFYNNSHYNLALPDSLTSIGSGAFHWNANAPISISSASIINVIKLGPDIDGEAAGDQSGISVSLSADGSTLAIGTSINDGTTGITSDNRGHVRVYKYQTITDATWTNYNATSFTYTGTSPNNKPIVVAGGDATPTPGKSYWVQNGADIDGEALGDFSGGSVSLSADGSTLAIGAGSNDGTIGTTSDNRGHVRVYKYQTIADSTWTNYNATSFTYTGTSPNNKPIAVAGGDATPTPGKSYWVQNGGDIDGELAGDSSGISVSLSADGSTVAIGANFNDGTTTSTSDNRGHVRVYKYDVNKITNVTDQSSDQYGPVGWRRLGKDIDGEALEDNSGGSVSLSADGLTVAIGARNNDGTTVISTGFSSDSRGHVRVYKYQTIADSTWTNYNATSLTYTGTSPNNKPIVVAGGDATPTPGKSYWVQIGGDIDGEAGGNYFYGFSCSLSADGSTVAIGAGSNNDNGLASGHVRVYKYDATKITNVIDQASDDFGPVGWRRRGKDIDGEAANDGAGFSGYPVSLSADGTIVAIGATSNDGTTGNTADNRGHVRIYQYDATKTTNVTDQASLDYGPAGWRRIGQDIDGEALSDNFGQSVSLSADGSTVAIGASYNDGTTVISTGFSSDNRGHVRVYKLNPTLTYDASVYIHEELYNNISGTLSTYFTNLSNVSFVVVRERLTSSSRITISQINNFYIRYRQYQLGIQTIAVDNIFDLAFAQAQLASSSGFIHLYINCDIPINAFVNNTKIYSVAIGPDVTSIGFGAFNGCTSLSYLSFHPDSICTTIGQGAFLGNNIFDLALPDSLTTIVGWAFQNSTQLTSVCIPNKVTSLGTGAFYNCSKLTSVALPASLTAYAALAYFNTNGTTVPTNMAVYNSYMDHTIPHFKLSDYSIPTGIVQNVIPSEVTYIDHRAYAYYPEITLYAINIPQTSGPYSYAANGVQFPIMPAAFLLNGGTIVSHSMFPLYRSIPDLNVYTVSSTASDKVDDTDDYYILMPGYSICIYNNLYDEENLFTDTPTYRYYDNEFGKVPLNIDVGTYNTASSILFMHKGRILSKKFVN